MKNGDRVEAFETWADDSRGEGVFWVCCGKGKDDPRLGVGGSEGEESEDEGIENEGDDGEARPLACEDWWGGGKAVEMARGIE